MLPARLATAILLVGALLAAVFWLERWAYALLIGGVVALASHEWGRLCGFAGRGSAAFAAAAASLFAVFALGWMRGADPRWAYAAGAAFWVFVVPAWLHAGVERRHRAWLPPAGLAVILPAAGAMLALPPRLLVAVLALTWVADTAAFFAGRCWGRRKLAPSVSPGKTVEGALAALVAVTFYAIICALLLPEFGTVAGGAAWAAVVGGALVLAAASIGGDLFESAVKRQAGAKDSGTLLPGHGGVLDRIDSATSTLPIAALMFHGMLMP